MLTSMPRTSELVVWIRLVSLLSALHATDDQVPYDLAWFAGLSDTLATFKRYLVRICGRRRVFTVASRCSDTQTSYIIYSPPHSAKQNWVSSTNGVETNP